MSDNMKQKYMNIKEFREKGYLQELNRKFLHPLGLALEVIIDDNGVEKLGGIWDSRDDLEGFVYDLKNSDNDRIKKFRKNEIYIYNQSVKYREGRVQLMGTVIEEIKNEI